MSSRMLAAAAVLACALAPAIAQPSSDDERMAWWREARFGLFIHWGLYSVAAGEWDGRPAPGTGEWIQRNARIPVHEYEGLAPRFDPVGFDARAWVSLARDAGMKYIVITSKHHDGFCLFDTETTWYDIIDATPFRRDPLRELADECERQGVRLCFYYSIWDWHNPDFARDDAGRDRMPQYITYMKAQLRELLTGYGDPGVLWFDGEWPPEWTEKRGKDLYEFCRSIRPGLIVNNRVGKARAGMAGISAYQGAGDYDTPEQEIPARGLPGIDWESCMTMNDTWGYRADDDNWKTAPALIRQLIETASKGGNYLLNVGPTGLGEIPPESVERLRAIGAWMSVNAEAIHGTSAGPFERLPWGRCTRKGDRLYLHVFDWPADGRLRVPGLRTAVASAWMLADPVGGLRVEQGEEDVVVHVPARAPDDAASVIALELAGEPVVVTPPVRPGADGVVVLHARDAECRGPSLRYERGEDRDNLGFWTDASASAAWELELPAGGRYAVEVEVASEDRSAGGEFIVSIGGQEVRGRVPATGGWGKFVMMRLETIALGAGGHTLTAGAGADFKGVLMNLRQVRLVPAP